MYWINRIILILVFSSLVFGKEPGSNFKLLYPKFIPQNSNFEVAIITSCKFSEADKLELYIIPDDKLTLNTIELKSVYENIKLSFDHSFVEALGLNAFKTVIDFTEQSLQETYFQVMMNFKSDISLNASVKFYGIYKNEEKILGYLTPSGAEPFERLVTANFHFFKTRKNSGRALQIGKYSQFEIALNKVDVKNLLAEFWIKLNDADVSILEIKNAKYPEKTYKIAVNEFQMLSVISNESKEYLTPFFTSKKAWYHVSVYFSSVKNKAYFYCNGTLFGKYAFPEYIPTKDLIFNFAVDDQNKTYNLELFRLIDFNNSIEQSFANRSYINFRADSSKVISQFRFDDNDEFNRDKTKLIITSNNIQLVKSDAPLLARAPELNINLLSNAYELEWNGGDYKQAAAYVLEKSINNSEYFPVFNIQADNASEKIYSYLDEKDQSSEVVYYRIKQVNLDGTSAFSSQVKVGQGSLEPFIVGQNFPNPFNPKTSIEVELFEDSNLEVIIYNLEGREIANLHKGYLSKGIHKFDFDASEFPSGIYLYKITTPDFSQTRKMILTK